MVLCLLAVRVVNGEYTRGESKFCYEKFADLKKEMRKFF